MGNKKNIGKRLGASFLAISILTASGPNLALAKAEEFQDIADVSKWAIGDVIEARDKGFLESKLKLEPKEAIKRGEFVRLLSLSLGLDIDKKGEDLFKDVPKDHKYFDYINTSEKHRLVMGSNGYFKPEENINREEMATIINRALDLKPKGKLNFRDKDLISKWALAAVENVASNGIIQGSGGEFNPKGLVSKEMAIVISIRAKNYCEKARIKDNLSGETIDISSTVNYLLTTNDNPTVGTMNGDWSILAMARSGYKLDEEYLNRYYKNVEDYVKEKKGKLHRVKYTEYSRLILSLTAIGKDPRNVGGYNLLDPLADFNSVIKQGINGPIFALIALDSKGYELGDRSEFKNQTSREKLISFILERQLADGGWNLGQNAESSDVDITAMALQALARYRTRPDVKEAINRGLDLLSRLQKEDGSYTSWGAKNSESIAQVIVALTSLGINPKTDPRFIKNNRSSLDALLGFRDKSGGFYHIKEGDLGNGGGQPGEVDIMATDQALYGIVSYNRLLRNEKKLYDMTE